ncbi:PRTRC system protein B [Mucilaginibacter conchicola]|nr:PRTRC system protein B [Mucilaginibacter conchicola]
MKNVTEQFNIEYKPFKALLFYRYQNPENDHRNFMPDDSTDLYVESYDIGKQGQPINAHPLSISEMVGLSEVFSSAKEMDNGYLRCKELLPHNLLSLDQRTNGHALWYTPTQQRVVFFTENLGIPSGRASVPAMVWKATADTLSVFALKGKAKPNESTPLYHAPFLNIYSGGNVCMGNVAIQITKQTSLAEFMQLWEEYFFQSNFSHSINGSSSTKDDTVALWRTLIGRDEPFPQEQLVKTHQTLKSLL